MQLGSESSLGVWQNLGGGDEDPGVGKCVIPRLGDHVGEEGWGLQMVEAGPADGQDGLGPAQTIFPRVPQHTGQRRLWRERPVLQAQQPRPCHCSGPR